SGLSDALTQADLVVGRALDLQPPAPPTDLVATPGDQQVALSWTASPDADDLAGYFLQQGIERNGSLVYDFLAIVDPPATSFVSTGLENGTTYFYVVTAFDAAGNENDFLESARAEATPQDDVAPAPPTGFAAVLDAGTVALTWVANADADLEGYRLYRDLASAPTALLAALSADATAYTDADVEDGTAYFYRLTAFDDDGNESAFSDEVEVRVTTVSADEGPALPTAYALDGLYPNPVSGTATVSYALPEAASVTVEVFDLLGARVAVLTSTEQPAGYHEIGWTPDGLAAGTYLLRLRAGDFAATQRLVVLR
ncbi:MAG: T9SS type A sorting domain-containing protein, partial [Bacteroidota bacterium]